MAAKDFDLFGGDPETGRECIIGERVRIACRRNGTILQQLGDRMYRILEEPCQWLPLVNRDGDNHIIIAHDCWLRQVWH